MPLLYGYNALGQASIKMYTPDTVPLNQLFALDIVFEKLGEHDTVVSESIVKLQALKDFIVVSGPITYTSSTFNTGVAIHSNSYRYYLKPMQIGNFNPGQVTAIINNKTVQSDEILIAVTPSVDASKLVTRLASSESPISALPYNSVRDTSAINNVPVDSSSEAIEKAKKDVFLIKKLSKDTIHIGEKITATLFIYFRNNITELKMDKLYGDGFKIVEDTIQRDSQVHPSEETVNGKKFQFLKLQKIKLYPQRTGKLKVGPYSISMVAQVPDKKSSRSFFDDFFAENTFKQVPLTIIADSKTVIVLPKK